MPKLEKHRVQFDFAPGALERLDELVTSSGSTSRAEVVRRALALFEKITTAQREDRPPNSTPPLTPSARRTRA